MGAILGLATLLGGIAAVWFFWDRITSLFSKPVPPPSEPEVIDVDLNYIEDSGLAAGLRSDGYRLYWAAEDKLTRLLDLEGWELVIESKRDGRRVRYRVKDPIRDLHLIRQRDLSAL